jgi:hypothetical protein
MAFQVSYTYIYVKKLCRQQAQDTQNHENATIPDIRKDKAKHRKCERFKLGGGQAYDRPSD